MSTVTAPLVLDSTGQELLEGVTAIKELLEAKNHLDSHRNAALDLLASDKRAELSSNLDEIVELVQNREILEAMDYGDQIVLPWKEGETNYNPAMNLCHFEDAELEDGETIPVIDVEWDKTTPTGVPFDEPEAIYESDADTAAGTYNFLVANDSWGNNNGKYIQFTLPEVLPAGYQIRKSVGYNALITSGTLDVYESAASRTKLYSMTPTEGQGGTYLGKTDGTGDLNNWHRVALGYARWKYSCLRQRLNSTAAAGAWYTKQNKWDVAPAVAATLDGFLHGYTEDQIRHFRATKIVTVAANADNNEIDITYDRVFLSSLEQMYAVPQQQGEGEYWEYYKRLLGRTTPAPTSQTYTRLIKYAINAPTSAQNCWRRSCFRYILYNAWVVYASGTLTTNYASYAYRCAPCLRIG